MSAASFASRWNLDLIEENYRRWQSDPDSVDSHWQAFFQGFDLAAARPHAVSAALPTGLFDLVDAYRAWGHLSAHLNPLDPPPETHRFLEPGQFGFREEDMGRHYDGIPFLGLPSAPLRDLVTALKETYSRTIGVEYMHIQDLEIRRWFQEKMEPRRNRPDLSRQQKLRLLRKLHYADLFEKFLAGAYQGAKRFGLEGVETMIPVLDTIIEKTAELGGEEIVIGMPHRGRLNVLCNILRKPYHELFAEFEDILSPDVVDGDGDVKYHLGYSYDHETTRGQKIHLSLTPNPSHLEAVDPVVQGRVRAKQRMRGDSDRKHVIPLLIHGDAAFAGQGIVAETLNMSQLAGYRTGGTVHLVVNNQLGFTTSPKDGRSTIYCTDVGKMIDAPVLHVNAEDPEVCVYAAELAVEFRQRYGRDVLIDLVGYRKHGHNETDDPTYTMPVMYEKIRGRKPITQIYAEQLTGNGDLSPGTIAQTEQEFQQRLSADREVNKVTPPKTRYMSGFGGRWVNLRPKDLFTPADTSVRPKVLQTVGEGVSRVPEGFVPHVLLGKQLKERAEQFADKQPINWIFAEQLAIGTLLLDGFRVRISGQDVRRGTFTHRQDVWYDVRNNEPYIPLNHLEPNQASLLRIYDSLLSEAAVVGFEYGYSLDDPNTLVIWEAQFGDFVNGAQVIIDQFVTSSESKWRRASGLVLLLPHGMEGMGPEHSSARLERFLQACAENNMQVCQPTTAAQYFHLLRRQMKRGFRKPLVVMTPKWMLRQPEVASPHDDFLEGGFVEVLDDAAIEPGKVKRILFCTGKVALELGRLRAEKEIADVAIVRLEQLYPFHDVLIKKVLARYGKAKEVVWVQEEPQNCGAWFFVQPRFAELGCQLLCCSRDASASPAVGSHRVHEKEQKELMEVALEGAVPHLVRAFVLVLSEPKPASQAQPAGKRTAKPAAEPNGTPGRKSGLAPKSRST